MQCTACRAVKCRAVQCRAVHRSELQCSCCRCWCGAVHCSAVQCNAMQCRGSTCDGGLHAGFQVCCRPSIPRGRRPGLGVGDVKRVAPGESKLRVATVRHHTHMERHYYALYPPTLPLTLKLLRPVAELHRWQDGCHIPTTSQLEIAPSHSPIHSPVKGTQLLH